MARLSTVHPPDKCVISLIKKKIYGIVSVSVSTDTQLCGIGIGIGHEKVVSSHP